MSINLNKLQRMYCKWGRFEDSLKYFDMEEEVTIIYHSVDYEGKLKDILEQHPEFRNCFFGDLYRDEAGNSFILLE